MRKEGSSDFEPLIEDEKLAQELLGSPTQSTIVDTYAGEHLELNSPRYTAVADELFSGGRLSTRIEKMFVLACLKKRDIAQDIEKIFDTKAVRQLKRELQYLIDSAEDPKDRERYQAYLDSITKKHKFPDLNIKIAPLSERGLSGKPSRSSGRTNLQLLHQHLDEQLPGEISFGNYNDWRRIRTEKGQGPAVPSSPQSSSGIEGMDRVDKAVGLGNSDK